LENLFIAIGVESIHAKCL